MLPKEKKQKKGTEKDDKEDKTKRRNSLTDTSSVSTSSTSSSVDSDEASSSSGCDTTKATMTSLEQGTSGSDVMNNGTGDSGSYRRTIRTDTPVEELAKDIGFTSLSMQYPLANTQPSPPLRNTEKEKVVAKKAGKPGNKKKREKKEKKEKKEKEAKEAAAVARVPLDLDHYRAQHEHDRLKKEVLELYNLNPKPQRPTFETRPGIGAFYPTKTLFPRRTEQDKLKATIGFGIAATGLYDTVPCLVGARGNEYKGKTYSDLVGNKRDNWRTSYEQIYMRESNAFGVMNIEWEAIVGHKEDLKRMVNKMDCNKWIRRLLQLVLEGKIKKFWRRVEVIQRVLREHAGDHPYRSMSKSQLVELVMQRIVNMLSERSENFNVIMYLVSHSFVPPAGQYRKTSQPCFYRNHNDCMLAESILLSLPPVMARRLLSQTTITTERRAIHFAAIAGTPCQLDMLLKFDVNTSLMDASGRAPIHYTIARNNTLMMRQLMWHGTDLSLYDSVRRKQPCDDLASDNFETVNFLQNRLVALERCMSAWLKALCAGKLKLGAALSSLHCVRLAPDGDRVENCMETSKVFGPWTDTPTHELQLAMRDNEMLDISQANDVHIVLFILPVMFSPYDPLMPAENPHIVRVKMAKNDCEFRLPASPMTADPTVHFTCGGSEQRRTLPTAFHERHNGYLYAYKFPKNIDRFCCPTLSLFIDPSEMGETATRHTSFFVQAYSVSNLTQKQKCE